MAKIDTNKAHAEMKPFQDKLLEGGFTPDHEPHKDGAGRGIGQNWSHPGGHTATVWHNPHPRMGESKNSVILRTAGRFRRQDPYYTTDHLEHAIHGATAFYEDKENLDEFVGLGSLAAGALTGAVAGIALNGTKAVQRHTTRSVFKGQSDHDIHLDGLGRMQDNGWDFSHDAGAHAVWQHPTHGEAHLGADEWKHVKEGKTIAHGKNGPDLWNHFVAKKKYNPDFGKPVKEETDILTKKDRVLKKVLDLRNDVEKSFSGNHERSLRFIGKHVVVRSEDPEGNGDDVFKATNVGKDHTNSAKDLLPGEDEYVYESSDDEKASRRAAVARMVSDAEKRPDTLGYVTDRIGRYKVVQGVGKHGGDWFAVENGAKGEKVKHSSREDAVSHARASQPDLEESLSEHLNPKMGPGAYIQDFVKSENPKFAGKSKAARTRMALGAYYGAKRKLKEETLEEADSKISREHGYGYHGEASRIFGSRNAGKKYDEMHGHVMRSAGLDHNQARIFLDSASGRHLSDQVHGEEKDVHPYKRDDLIKDAVVLHKKRFGRNAFVDDANESVLHEASHLIAFHPGTVKERQRVASEIGTHFHHDYEGNHVGLTSAGTGRELHGKMLGLGYAPSLNEHPHEADVGARDQEYWKDGENGTRHRVTFKRRRTSDKLHEVEMEHWK